MLRISSLGWLACVFAVFSADVASAQRDAGAKARGEFGTGFWNSQYSRSGGAARTTPNRSPQGSVYARRQTPQEREYRVSSYEPTRSVTGDTVTIVKDSASVMRGSERLGTLDKGHQFKVLKVLDGWLGTVVEDDGQVIRGWVWHEDASPVTAIRQPGS